MKSLEDSIKIMWGAKVQREKDRAEVAELLLKGWKQADIAAYMALK
jgi:hypothetical protein